MKSIGFGAWACLWAAALVGLALAVAQSPADDFALYGSQTSGNVDTWGLVRFDDPTIGKTTRIGAGGLMFDLDFGPDGKLYSPRGSSGLYRVNINDGSQQKVGDWGIAENMTALAFAPGGALFAHDNEGLATSLYSIDPKSGQAKRIGGVGDYVFGMDFAPDGTLYGSTAGEIFKIDPKTGAKGEIVGSPNELFTGLDFGADGIFRGVASLAGGNGALFTIDTQQFASHFVGRTDEASMDGLASVPEPASAILVGLALLGQRRRPG